MRFLGNDGIGSENSWADAGGSWLRASFNQVGYLNMLRRKASVRLDSRLRGNDVG